MFQVTDRIRMKRNLRKIDTYGISPSIIKEHRKTIFWVRKVSEYVGEEGAIRIYKYAKVYDKKLKKYVNTIIDFDLAYLNPDMFEKVEV